MSALGLSSMDSTVDLSIVIPVKGHERTVVSTVESLLTQEFEGTYEVIAVVSSDNGSYRALCERFTDLRLKLLAPDTAFPFEGRDANWRRGLGLRAAKGDFLALVDADIVFDADWAQRGVEHLRRNGISCVAGTMSRAKNGFWPRYTDSNFLFPKTPRFLKPYVLTRDNFGLPHRKPGVTANMFFTRELFETVGPPPVQFVRSYQDYSFFWEIISAGYQVLCTSDISGSHFHRERTPDLIREYWVSGLGCADFIRHYPEAPFAKLRLAQVMTVLVLIAAGMAALLRVPVWTLSIAALGLALIGVLAALKTHSLVAVLYPLATLILGLVFSAACIYGLLNPNSKAWRAIRKWYTAKCPPGQGVRTSC
jgi:GT2 family glycosyltransferase